MGRLMLALAPVAMGLSMMLAGAAEAQDDEAAHQARWHDLKKAVFGAKPVKDGGDMIVLDAPLRALDAALVPISITLKPEVKAKGVYITIDDNPSPLAGTFRFGPAGDPHLIKTRVRVDSYTYIHAIVETADGQLYSTARFVKASGGCSAPGGTDEKEALERLGQMRVKRVAETAPSPDATELQLLVSHPNYNGMQMNQVTRNYTPARFVQDIKVTSGGKLVFDLQSDISLSENPAITFGLLPQGVEPVKVEVHDSSGAAFVRQFDVPAKSA